MAARYEHYGALRPRALGGFPNSASGWLGGGLSGLGNKICGMGKMKGLYCTCRYHHCGTTIVPYRWSCPVQCDFLAEVVSDWLQRWMIDRFVYEREAACICP
jgi:hypothetical protein